MLEESFQRQPDVAWAVATISESVANLRELFQLILPGSNPQISLLAAEGETGLASLRGLDRFWNLGALVPLWDQLASLTTLEPVDLTSVTMVDAEAREWLRLNDIASIWAMPIRAQESLPDDLSQTESTTMPLEQGWRTSVSAYLVLWLSLQPNAVQAGAVASLFRRVGHFIQIIIGLASMHEPIGRNRGSGPLSY